jgi:hypothetical protein
VLILEIRGILKNRVSRHTTQMMNTNAEVKNDEENGIAEVV